MAIMQRALYSNIAIEYILYVENRTIFCIVFLILAFLGTNDNFPLKKSHLMVWQNMNVCFISFFSD